MIVRLGCLVLGALATGASAAEIGSVPESAAGLRTELVRLERLIPGFRAVPAAAEAARARSGRRATLALGVGTSLTAQRLRGITLDDSPPVLRPFAAASAPELRDDLPAGAPRPYVAAGIKPFAFRHFNNAFNYGGRHTHELVAYAATHGFGSVFPYTSSPDARTELPEGTRFMTWMVVNWSIDLMPPLGIAPDRWDLLAGADLSAALGRVRWPEGGSHRIDQLMIDMEDVVHSPRELRRRPWYPTTATDSARREFEANYYAGYIRSRREIIEAARRAGFRNIGLYGDDLVKPAWFALLDAGTPDDSYWQAYQSDLQALVDVHHTNLYVYFWSPRNTAFALTVLDLERARRLQQRDERPSRPYFWNLMHGGSDAPGIWNRDMPVPDEEARATALLALMSGVDGITQWNWSGLESHVSVPPLVVSSDLQLRSPAAARVVGSRRRVTLQRYDALRVAGLHDEFAQVQRIDRAATRPPYGTGPGAQTYELPLAALRSAIRARAEPVAAVIEGLALARAVEGLLAAGQPVHATDASRNAFRSGGVVHRLVRAGQYLLLATYDPGVAYGGRPRTLRLQDAGGLQGLQLVAPADENVRLWVIDLAG